MSSDTETLPDTVLSTRSLRYLHEIEVHGGVRAAADALSTVRLSAVRWRSLSVCMGWRCSNGAAGA
jgi:hypothetical protein